MVLQEDGGPNNGGSSDRTRFSPKKPKTNKIPQRGLGIAALEKLRREDQQRRISSTYSAGDSIAGASAPSRFSEGGEHSLSTVISPTPYLPGLEQSSIPCKFGNYALFREQSDAGNGIWSKIQSESTSNSISRVHLLPRRPQQDKQKSSLVIKNFLTPPLSSEATLQMEPPSNQSYVSINPPSLTQEQKLASMKRSWPFQPRSTQHCGENYPKRIAFSRLRDDVPSSSHSQANALEEDDDDAKLDGSLLSLSLLPVSEPGSILSKPAQKHNILSLQQIQKRREEKVSAAAAAAASPTLYNFMGLPKDLIGSHAQNANADFKEDEAEG